jgi:hypothetical protein
VAGAENRFSDIWKVWAMRGSGRRDVYMTSRPLGYAMKLSLHESGRWHIGFHADRRDQLFDPGSAPESRFLGQWDAASRLGAQPITLAARVIFPWGCATLAHTELPAGLAQIPNAPDHMAIEVALFLLDHDEPEGSWPGKNSMGTAFVGRVPLDGGGGATLVSRVIDMPQEALPRQGQAQYFAGRSREDLHDANRLVAWGQAEDGSICFMEAGLHVQIPRVG